MKYLKSLRKPLLVLLSFFVFLSAFLLQPVDSASALDLTAGYFGKNVNIYTFKHGGNREIDIVFVIKVTKSNRSTIFGPDFTFKDSAFDGSNGELTVALRVPCFKMKYEGVNYGRCLRGNTLNYKSFFGFVITKGIPSNVSQATYLKNDPLWTYNRADNNSTIGLNDMAWLNNVEGELGGTNPLFFSYVLNKIIYLDTVYYNFIREQEALLASFSDTDVTPVYTKSLNVGNKINFTDLNGLNQDRINDINWLSSVGITVGATCSNGKTCFLPNNTLNRGAMIEFIYKLSQSPSSNGYSINEYDYGSSKLSSLNNNARLNAIKWFAGAGLTSPADFSTKTHLLSFTTYNPTYCTHYGNILYSSAKKSGNKIKCDFSYLDSGWNDTDVFSNAGLNISNAMTRGAMAEFLYRLAGSPGAVNTSYYITDNSRYELQLSSNEFFQATCSAFKQSTKDTVSQTNVYFENLCLSYIKGEDIENILPFITVKGISKSYYIVIDEPALNNMTSVERLSLEDSEQVWLSQILSYPSPSSLTAQEKKFANDKDMQALKKSNPTRYYCILWLAKMNITLGVNGTGIFAPNKTVTRGAMAQFLHKFYYVLQTAQPAPSNGIIPNV